MWILAHFVDVLVQPDPQDSFRAEAVPHLSVEPPFDVTDVEFYFWVA